MLPHKHRLGLWLCLSGLFGCTTEPADLKTWHQRLASQPVEPLPDWPNAATPYQLANDAPLALTLFSPELRRPTSAEGILAFYPLAQLRYVGHISTPTERWAIIHTPQGPQLATQGTFIGLEAWTLSHIEAAALTLTPKQADAATMQLPLTPTPTT